MNFDVCADTAVITIGIADVEDLPDKVASDLIVRTLRVDAGSVGCAALQVSDDPDHSSSSLISGSGATPAGGASTVPGASSRAQLDSSLTATRWS